MPSTTEHIPLNSGRDDIFIVTIDIDSMFDTAYGNFTRKKYSKESLKKKKKNRAAKKFRVKGSSPEF